MLRERAEHLLEVLMRCVQSCCLRPEFARGWWMPTRGDWLVCFAKPGERCSNLVWHSAGGIMLEAASTTVLDP